MSLNHFFARSCIFNEFDSFADVIRYSVASLPSLTIASLTSLMPSGQSGICLLYTSDAADE